MTNARQKLRCDDLSHVLEEQAVIAHHRGTAGWTKCLGLDSVSTPRWITSAYLAYENLVPWNSVPTETSNILVNGFPCPPLLT